MSIVPAGIFYRAQFGYSRAPGIARAMVAGQEATRLAAHIKEMTLKQGNRGLMAAGVLGVALFIGQTGSVHAQKLRDTGVCHLTNVKAKKVIYDGECRITQEAKDYGALISIKMGKAEPMKFGCQKDGSCMTGATKVRMRDRGNGSANFRWEDFRLDVDAD